MGFVTHLFFLVPLISQTDLTIYTNIIILIYVNVNDISRMFVSVLFVTIWTLLWIENEWLCLQMTSFVTILLFTILQEFTRFYTATHYFEN